ncbi:MAG TPA: dihydrofolate reductase family protein [Solirubrobacteraceae bacterium]|jgi:riboflavin-specific deaminase-like protein
MDAAADPDRSPPSEPFTLNRLLPPAPPATVAAIVEGLGLHVSSSRAHAGSPLVIPSERPYLMLNMVSTVDGRATVAGRSGPIGNRADRELFHGLRAAVDAVMAGAGTVRVERYGRIVPDPSRRRLRLERGLSEEPLACIVSGRLDLPPDLPLLAEPAARVAIVTPSAASLTESAAHVDYVRGGRDGQLDLALAMAELRERFQVRTLLCEGGPHLNSHLLAAGLVDELFLCLSPKLAGGDLSAAETPLRILSGMELEPPVELELVSVLESDDSTLFLRYRVKRPE